jgi:hypothetical protein
MSQKNEFLTVTTCLWEDPARDQIRSYKFTPRHVITLRNMVRRNLAIPHEFVCLINSGEYVRPLYAEGIRTVAMDMSKHVPGTVCCRLMLRRPDIGGILGRRIVSLDLDIVITGNVDAIFGREEDNVLWRNPNYEPGGRRAFYQSSIQLFDAGARSFLYTDFDPKVTPTWMNRRFGGAEQAWFAERLPWDEAHWDASHGIYGAGRLFDGKMGSGVGSELPENARIVSFPGNREPSQAEVKELHPWVKEHYR